MSFPNYKQHLSSENNLHIVYICISWKWVRVVRWVWPNVANCPNIRVPQLPCTLSSWFQWIAPGAARPSWGTIGVASSRARFRSKAVADTSSRRHGNLHEANQPNKWQIWWTRQSTDNVASVPFSIHINHYSYRCMYPSVSSYHCLCLLLTDDGNSSNT